MKRPVQRVVGDLFAAGDNKRPVHQVQIVQPLGSDTRFYGTRTDRAGCAQG
jgi:hypothetical protein